MTKRRSFLDKFKATVALEALRGDRTAQEIAAKHKVHPTQVKTWKRQAIDGLIPPPKPRRDETRRDEDALYETAGPAPHGEKL
jgi:transposase-like protein